MARVAGERTSGADARSVDDASPLAAADAERGARRPLRDADPVLAVVVAAGAALRFWGLGRQSYWYDEWLTARAAAGGRGQLYGYVTDQAGIPPTYFVVTWLWARLAGTGEIALRSVSALAGIATVVVVYLAARALAQPRAVARVAALLVAVNPMLVWYSQEARPYSAVALLVALTVLFGTRWLTDGRRLHLGLFAAAGALAVAVHYYAAFLVAIEVAILLVRRPPRRGDLASLVPAAAVLALLAPFGARQFGRRGNHAWITDFPLSYRVRDAGTSALVGPSPIDARLWLVAAAAVAVAAVTAAVTGGRGARLAAAGLAGVGVGAVLLAWLATLVGVDAFVSRYLIGSLVPLALAVAVACVVGRPRVIGAAVVAVLVGVSLVAVVGVQRTEDLQRADWRAVADAHASGRSSSDGPGLLVVDRGPVLARPLDWYVDGGRQVGAGESVDVDRVDVVTGSGTDHPCNLLAGLGCGFVFTGAPLRGAAAGRFVEVERIEAGQFVLVRYRSDQPVPLTPANFGPRSRPWTPFLIVDG